MQKYVGTGARMGTGCLKVSHRPGLPDTPSPLKVLTNGTLGWYYFHRMLSGSLGGLVTAKPDSTAL